jgi:hypothetical protein
MNLTGALKLTSLFGVIAQICLAFFPRSLQMQNTIMTIQNIFFYKASDIILEHSKLTSCHSSIELPIPICKELG